MSAFFGILYVSLFSFVNAIFDKSRVVPLVDHCAEYQPDPIHLFDVLHDFIDMELRTL